MGEPLYHHPIHLEAYDTVSPTHDDGGISLVFYALKELLYDTPNDVPRPQACTSTDKLITSYFAFDYLGPGKHISDAAGNTYDTYEHVKLDLEHTQYLGACALEECFKVQFQTSVHGENVPSNRFTSIYYFEKSAGEDGTYAGSMIRPVVFGGDNNAPQDEPVTSYDCEYFFDQIAEIVTIIEDSSEAEQNS